MPEVAFLGAGLGLQLAAYRFNRVAVALVAGQVVEGKQVLALINIVQVVFLRVIGLNDAVILDEVIEKILGEGQNFSSPVVLYRLRQAVIMQPSM